MLKQGAVGLLPTDTIYGLSCRALDAKTVEKTRQLKGRDGGKPFIILIPSPEILNLLSISEDQVRTIAKYWPDRLSVVFDAPAAPAWLLGANQTLAVRWPNSPELIKLMNKVGPLISTSANLQGLSPAKTAAAAEAVFGDQLDFYVNAGKLDNPPSTLVAIKRNKLQVIRQGAVKIDEKELL